MTDLVYDFKAWLKTQLENKTYNYLSNDNCAFAQYLKTKGFKEVSVHPDDYSYRDANGVYQTEALPRAIDNALFYGPTFFGKLLERLENVE